MYIFIDRLSYLVVSCMLGSVCLPAVLFPLSHWGETPLLQAQSQALSLSLFSFSSLLANEMQSSCQHYISKIIESVAVISLLASNPIFMLLDNVNGSTGMPTLVADVAAAPAAAAASNSFCSRSLFFLFSSYRVG